MFKFIFTFVAFFFLVPSLASAQTIPSKPFSTAGAWEITMYPEDKLCVGTRAYQIDNDVLSVLMSSEGINLYFSTDAAGHFQVGNTAIKTLIIDSIHTVQSTAVSPNMIELRNAPMKFLNEFTNGTTLTMNGWGEYSLNGTYNMFNELVDCFLEVTSTRT